MGVFVGHPTVTQFTGVMGISHQSVDHPKGLQGVNVHSALGVLKIC
jgi:hypothetical protein